MREIIKCKNCNKEYYDQYNLICLVALDFCLKCANGKYNKEQIMDKYDGK